MENSIQDYGTTVSSQVYIDALQGHPYIPQSDQTIRNIIKKYIEDSEETYFSLHPHHLNPYFKILDLGCGPGRLTSSVAFKNCEVIGVDISESFIEYATNQRVAEKGGYFSFQTRDFATDGVMDTDKDKTFDVIFMQGVMHHIHDEERVKFLKKSSSLLKPGGILIIGDEFIKPYEDEEERILNVAKFYLHIIDEARNGGFNELAKEEAKNLIDDCFSGTAYAGYATEETFEIIYKKAQELNALFYSHGGRLNFNANNDMRNMLGYIKASTEHLIESSTQSFNRGDRKVSINVFSEEASLYGFKLDEIYRIGPVDQLGGMGVLVFHKE
jgi:SAM-dependent methyltransferase